MSIAAFDGDRGENPHDEVVTEEHPDVVEELSNGIDWLVAELYITYHTYRQFAKDCLGITLQELVGIFEQEGWALRHIEETIEEFSSTIDRIEQEFDGVFQSLAEDLGVADEIDKFDLDDIAEAEAEELAKMFENLEGVVED